MPHRHRFSLAYPAAHFCGPCCFHFNLYFALPTAIRHPLCTLLQPRPLWCPAYASRIRQFLAGALHDLLLLFLPHLPFPISPFAFHIRRRRRIRIGISSHANCCAAMGNTGTSRATRETCWQTYCMEWKIANTGAAHNEANDEV